MPPTKATLRSTTVILRWVRVTPLRNQRLKMRQWAPASVNALDRRLHWALPVPNQSMTMRTLTLRRADQGRFDGPGCLVRRENIGFKVDFLLGSINLGQQGRKQFHAALQQLDVVIMLILD